MPKTFADLLVFLDDLIPFAACMALLMLIWYQHYVFFIRYGFKDAKIVAINTLLLFLILFYIYPLKFLFKILYQLFPALITSDQDVITHLFTTVMPFKEAPVLTMIYGFGATAIFFTLTWMYYIAWRRSEKLELSESETFDTKMSMIHNFLKGIIPAISFFVSFIGSNPITSFSNAGMVYWAYLPLMLAFRYFSNKKRAKLLLIRIDKG